MRRVNDERGVTVVVVCLLAVAIMMVAAYVLDVAALLQEKRELQNGADAAALAVAQSCALDGTSTDCLRGTAAAEFADANAADATSTVDSVVVDTASRTVTVATSTRTSSGSGILPFTFGRVSGESGKTMRATATAAWVPLGNARTIPLAISRCEFDALLAGGSAFDTRTVIFKTADLPSATGCYSQPAGKDIPGGFGWLDDTLCREVYTAGQRVSADPGVDISRACASVLPTLPGQTVLIPLYDDYAPPRPGRGGGTKAEYRIAGFGAFVVEGYRFPGMSWGLACPSNQTCLTGYFTHYVETSSPGPAGDFGAYFLRLVS